MEPPPISQTLLAIVANQVARTDAVFEDLSAEVFKAEPGGSCNSVQRICEHLVQLRLFQLMLLGTGTGERPQRPTVASIEEAKAALQRQTNKVREAISTHDPDDWFTPPPAGQPRPGPWGDEATIHRVARPLNDFTNHIGAIRAIRAMLNAPAETTQ